MNCAAASQCARVHRIVLAIHRLLALAIAAVPLALFVPSAWADDAHFAFELAVDPPANMQDPFHVQLSETLVGARPGLKVAITYKVLVVDPDNYQSVLLGPVTESNSFGGGHGQSTIEYWPRQNGEFTFRIVRIDGELETILVERHVATDKALTITLSSPPGTSPDGQFTITGIRTVPEHPTVGQPVTIEVDATNSGTQLVSQTVPVVLRDDSGDQTLAIGSFTLDAGLSGTGSVSWVPDRASIGELKAGNQILPIAVQDGAAGATSNQSDQPDVTDGPPDDNGGN